jgi:hypothetical protein
VCPTHEQSRTNPAKKYSLFFPKWGIHRIEDSTSLWYTDYLCTPSYEENEGFNAFHNRSAARNTVVPARLPEDAASGDAVLQFIWPSQGQRSYGPSLRTAHAPEGMGECAILPFEAGKS